MAVGRPISLTPNIATKSLSSTATADQTSFTVTGGYRINELGVYRNGVRLVQGKDFTADDGSTVTLLSAATVDDIIDFQIFDSFNIADALNSIGNQTIDGNLTATAFYGDGTTLTGVGTVTVSTNSIQVSGITTLGTESTVVGSAVTFDASGGTIVGVVTATSFSGDGSSLTGVANTDYIDAASLTVAGIATFNGVGNFDAEVTAAGGVDVTGGVKSAGIVTFTNTTASTSTTTGALVVSGGVGIAGSLHVGENVSVGGTLTYEDVTNIDSVGIITARSGIVVSGGEVSVGVAYSVGNAGVVTAKGATFNGDVTFSGNNYNAFWDKSDNTLKFTDNSKAIFGDHSGTGDLHIYANGTNSLIQNNTGYLGIQADTLYLQDKTDGHAYITCVNDGAVGLRYDNSEKLSTTPTGVNVTGVATASDYYIGVGGTSVHTALGTKATTGKAIAMAMVFG